MFCFWRQSIVIKTIKDLKILERKNAEKKLNKYPGYKKSLETKFDTRIWNYVEEENMDLTPFAAKKRNELCSPKKFPEEATIAEVKTVIPKKGPSMGQEKILLVLQSGDALFDYFANKTTIGNFTAKYGIDSAALVGKRIKLSAMNMLINGKMQAVLFGEPV